MYNIKTEWDLKRYFFESINDKRIKEGIDLDLENLKIYIEKYKGRIASLNNEEFLQFMEDGSIQFKNMTLIHHYYSYLNTLDTQDQSLIKKMGELSNLWADAYQDLLFIDEEYKQMGYSKFIEMSKLEMFEPYKNAMINTANSIKYILTEGQEKNLIEVGKVISIFDDMYSELTNSFEYDFRGEKKTESEILSLRMSDDESIRKDAVESIMNQYGENKIVVGNIYRAVCKDNISDIKIRGYESVMHTRNLSEEMEDDVVNKLLDTVKSNYHMYHRHLKNKAKFLGKDKLEFHDVLAPIPAKRKNEFSFDEGFDFYMKNIKEFDQEFYDYSLKIFEDGRVSVFPKQGKMSGAYASYNKDVESFVMLNHTSEFDSIMTLAHELGHAIHGWYSQIQKECVYGSPLSLAETASIFNETFVFEEILKTVSKEERDYYIMKNLDDIFSTTFRQVMYVDFERECHNRFLDGEELSYEDFNEIWLKKNKEFYGDSVNVPEMAKHGWSVIPHIFHTPFYCYSYSFGNILSFNLYKMYKDAEDKKKFIEMYKNILRAGGSKRPKDLLMENGIDITSEEFYNKALEVITGLMDSIENKELIAQ
ncbi:MAG: M3 family metallopeptidase [Nanoarchaeota archaeon]